MSIVEYLAAFKSKLDSLVSIIATSSLHEEIDSNVGIGFIRGQVIFVDGSRFEFTEQLPIERQKFRLNFMDAENQLVVRWDSAPHHKSLPTFPFHKHTQQGVEPYPAITTLDALDEIAKLVKT